jgi:hypothetical protein
MRGGRTVTPFECNALLTRWIKPSSLSEKDRQDRAERMIKTAIDQHPPFEGENIAVYAKGSYPNNTNVRLDSDVDIVVENGEVLYYEDNYDPPAFPPAASHGPAYQGQWTPEKWRLEVTAALVNYIGASEVDTSGSIALVIAEKPGSRPSSDVVPSFQFRRYDSADHRMFHDGTKVFKADGGSIVNWPQQQLDNGRAKNTNTGQRYKQFARALKNAENALVRDGELTVKPSYLMECLAWNVPNSTLTGGSLDNGFRATLIWLSEHLNDSYNMTDWIEPNQLKYLFGSDQKWTVQDAKDLVYATWNYLDY